MASAVTPRATRSLLTATAMPAFTPSGPVPARATTPEPSARTVSWASRRRSSFERPSCRAITAPSVALRREVGRGGQRLLRLEPLELLLEAAHLLGEPLDPLGELLGRGAEQRGRAAQQRFLVLDVGERAVAGDRLDAPQVRADRALAHDLDRTDEAERVHVGTAAELGRRTGFEHADDVAVLLAEERDRADALGFGLRRLVVAHGRVGDHLLVGEPLHLARAAPA